MSARARMVGLGVLAGVLCLAAACSHQPRRADCDAHLEPINAVTQAASFKKSPDADYAP